jgi:hypothetical protein
MCIPQVKLKVTIQKTSSGAVEFTWVNDFKEKEIRHTSEPVVP